MWYAVYFIYGLDQEANAGSRSELSLQEDLLLLEARNRDEAYSRAVALGSEVGDFGRRLLQGEPNALRELGIEDVAFLSSKPQGSSGAKSPLVHAFNTEIYRGFHFLGLKDLVGLRTDPGDGTEVDIQELMVDTDQLATMMISATNLQAFSPAGTAYSGAAKIQEESRLYQRYHWYLAEQMFRDAHNLSENRAPRVKAIQRMVLLNASGPEEALRAAIDDACRWTRGTDHEFVGLLQLSLVTDDLRDGCELRTSIIKVAKESARLPVRHKADLKAFAE